MTVTFIGALAWLFLMIWLNRGMYKNARMAGFYAGSASLYRSLIENNIPCSEEMRRALDQAYPEDFRMAEARINGIKKKRKAKKKTKLEMVLNDGKNIH